MGLQFSTTVRNAFLDQLETTIATSAVLKIRSSTVPATCGTADAGTALVTYNLASDWAANASAGAKSFNGTPITGTASASGTAAHFRLYASDGTTCHMQGTVTATGGGGDMTVDNTNIAAAQQVNVTSFTITAPGA